VHSNSTWHSLRDEDQSMTESARPSPAPVRPLPPVAKSRLNRGRVIRIIIGMALLILVVGVMVWKETPKQSPMGAASTETQEAAKLQTGPSVQVMKPQRRDIARKLTLPANIAPWYQATLYAKVSGYLKEMRVDKGDEVKKGQIIAIIDAPEVADQYEQAKVDYAIKKLTYERLNGVFQENPDVIAKQDVDVAKAAADGAKHLRDTRFTLLSYTRVDAPFDGTITARFADPGAMIQAAIGSATQSTPLYTIMSIDTVRVYVSVPQEDAPLALPGVPATLNVKERSESEIKGTITRTTEALDPTTRTLLVEIDLPNKDHRLQPGTYVTASLYLVQHNQALVVPPAAILSEDGGKHKSVFVVEEGRARKVPIKTGIDDGIWVEVTDGLTGNEDVIVVGKTNVTDGHLVQARPYDLPSGRPGSQKM
jgi:membrane fusion protein (multidrug efflux system)